MIFIVKRKLKDYEAWMKIVSDNELRKARGSKGMTSYRSAKDPNEIYMIFEWDEDKPYTEYLNHPEVQKILAATGTTEVIEVSESFDLDG